MHVSIICKHKFSLYIHIIVNIQTFLLTYIFVVFSTFVGLIYFGCTSDFIHRTSFLSLTSILTPIGLPFEWLGSYIFNLHLTYVQLRGYNHTCNPASMWLRLRVRENSIFSNQNFAADEHYHIFFYSCP